MIEHPDHIGRRYAVDFLRKSRNDIAQDEDNRFAQGLQTRAYMHINAAIHATRKAIHQ